MRAGHRSPFPVAKVHRFKVGRFGRDLFVCRVGSFLVGCCFSYNLSLQSSQESMKVSPEGNIKEAESRGLCRSHVSTRKFFPSFTYLPTYLGLASHLEQGVLQNSFAYCSFREGGRKMGSPPGALWRPGLSFLLFGALGHRTLHDRLLPVFMHIRKRHPSFWGGHSSTPRCTAWRAKRGMTLSSHLPPLDGPFCAVPNLHNCTGESYLLARGGGQEKLG